MVTVTHNLPAGGYTVDRHVDQPGDHHLDRDAARLELDGPAQQRLGTETFQLTGTVANMNPGEVRQISTGTTVSATYVTSTGQQLTAPSACPR